MKRMGRLRTRITFSFIVAAVGPIGLLSVFMGLMGYQVELRQALENQQIACSHAGARIADFFRSTEERLRSFGVYSNFHKRTSDERWLLLSRLVGDDNGFETIAWISAVGKEELRVSRLEFVRPRELKDYAQEEEYLRAVNTGNVVYGTLTFNERSGEPYLSVVVPIKSQSEGIHGLLRAEIRMKIVWDLLRTLPTSPGEILFVLDKSNTVIAHPYSSVVLSAMQFFEPERSGVRRGISGEICVIAASHFFLGNDEYHLVSERPWGQALESLLPIAGFIAVSMLAAIALAVFLAALQGNGLVRPLEKLADFAVSLGSSAKGADTDSYGSYETSVLADSIIRMFSQKNLLLGELNHRLKNNLQIIAGLIALKSDDVRDAGDRESFLRMRDRINAMAIVHDLVYRSEDLSSIDGKELLEKLVGMVRPSLEGESRIAVRFDVESVSIPIEKAIAFCLLINEFLINALEHAFPDSRRGNLRIAAKGTEAGMLAVEITDDGIGMPESGARKKGLGSVVIASLSGQLRTRIEYAVPPGGGSAISFIFSTTPTDASLVRRTERSGNG